MSVRANAESLRRIPLFADSDPAHLQVLAFASEKIEFPAGAAIIRAGEPGDAAYLVLSGSVDVWEGSEDSRRSIAMAHAGALLGEVGMIAGIPYSINATASSLVVAARISRDLFMRVISEFPDFATSVHDAMARKIDLSMTDLDRVRKLFDGARSFSRR